MDASKRENETNGRLVDDDDHPHHHDGQEEKTINLELKDGKKQGYFGNAEGGYGTDDRYKGKFNINRFSKKMQFSAIGMLNNIYVSEITIIM